MPLPKIKTQADKAVEALGETIPVTCAVGTRPDHSGYWCAGLHWANGTSEKQVPVGKFYEFFLPHSRKHISVIKVPVEFGDKVGMHLHNRAKNATGTEEEFLKIDEEGLQVMRDLEEKMMASQDPDVAAAQERAAAARDAFDKAQKEADAAAKSKGRKAPKDKGPEITLTSEQQDAQMYRPDGAPTVEEYVKASFKQETYVEFIQKMKDESKARLEGSPPKA